jgi:hypothetical protein
MYIETLIGDSKTAGQVHLFQIRTTFADFGEEIVVADVRHLQDSELRETAETSG